MTDLNLAFWQTSSHYQKIQLALKNKRNVQACGLASIAMPSLLAALSASEEARPILLITSQDKANNLHKIANQIKRLSEASEQKSSIEIFPTSQVLPFDGLSESQNHYAKTSSILAGWLMGKAGITICSAKSLAQPVMEKTKFAEQLLKLKVGQDINQTSLLINLVQLGYRRVDTVTEIGTFALRGEILDVFPSSQIDDLPVRLNFFGDEIETIKPFEPWTQRSSSSQKLSEVIIPPLLPYQLPKSGPKENLAKELKNYASEIEEAQSQFWLEDLRKFATEDYGGDHWQRFIPWLEAQFVSPLAYFPENGLVVIDEPGSLTAQLEQYYERLSSDLSHKLERKMLPISQKNTLKNFIKTAQTVQKTLGEKNLLEIFLSPEPFLHSELIDFETALVPQFRANFAELQKFIEASDLEGKNVWLASSSENDLRQELGNLNLTNVLFKAPVALDRGFSLQNTTLLTDFEIFAKKAVIGTSKKSQANPEDYIPIDLQSIRPGDYLVHLKHGIGKFTKLKTIELEGKKREYIALEYLNGDLLNVPVDQMNLLTLYKGASEGQAPKLSRLGGIDWDKTKKTVKAAVEKIAEDLVELYAKRSLEEGFSFGPDSPWQTELEDSFPYKETSDQLKAVQEIKDDMESGRIMDRLLCGDVGFGKTEVVIRAAFKAIMAGKQVAVMAPTTILAQQHYKSFAERFGKFPVKVELLTRAKSVEAKKEALNKLKEGQTDIVIGTHAILGKQVVFKDLGLIIVDEEQKFGVGHKEKLKKLKENVAVLTVSATPIPRTLHMALSGIREMSLISTAPPGRVPIKTQIMPENLKLVRAAILRELERGGQVFYLHNRVESIQAKAVELISLVPEASFRVAHGRMNEAEITDVMEAFVNHEFDVLIATSIIENGIDIPNAGTMVIENAERLGLGQLYQLRGRVGRSNDPARPGYALLMHGPIASLNEQAKARLEAIARYSSLGSGYQIALRDMEIRGVGNMLGNAQHGKVISVGFELYCDMLNEAILKLKEQFKDGGANPEPTTGINKTKSSSLVTLEEKPVLDFKLNAYIPVDWIEDDVLRLREYQRLAEVSSLLQLTSLCDEWKDRFGEPPQPVSELLKIVRLRLLALSSNVIGIVRPAGQMIEFNAKITFASWKAVQAELPQWLRDRLAVRFPQDGYPKIMLRIAELNTKDQLDLLEELFKAMSAVGGRDLV
jgi:transcription-repair coupling factor (superfamily II helicase)